MTKKQQLASDRAREARANDAKAADLARYDMPRYHLVVSYVECQALCDGVVSTAIRKQAESLLQPDYLRVDPVDVLRAENAAKMIDLAIDALEKAEGNN